MTKEWNTAVDIQEALKRGSSSDRLGDVDGAIRILTDYRNEKTKDLRDALTMIKDIAYDHDGCKSVKDLKELIDELRSMAINALEGKPLFSEENTDKEE